ncbi:PDZ domain-containing protein [Caulobacter sp. 602-2]|uniref:PDZ domain-containing protein n=1 Tax=Caulobacter sp. 602-2 TaxID=2710887 RepID=A0A6G4QX19_9CAUL|nr:aspartyl protease family protein [Caulobacter sp. 602-2]NGM50007.1 PDZ domain-containing protein [Caulobacter sp. 602-2]
MRPPAARTAAAILLAGVLTAAHALASEPISFQGEINGKPARFLVDTGASALLTATAKGAERLELKIAEESAYTGALAGKFQGVSAPARVVLPGGAGRDAVFDVLQPEPEYVKFDFDAIWGWPGVHHRILYYTSSTGLQLDPSQAIDLSKAQIFPLVPEANVAIFDASGGGDPLPVLVDTGSLAGVDLDKPLWDAWRRAHPDHPVTLLSYYSPAIGPIVAEQAFVRRLKLGALVLHNVLVTERPASQVSGVVQARASLGLDVFKNQGLWLDGKGGKVAFLPKPPAPVLYNRGGVTFVPPAMRAVVARGGPASRAGVADGDTLLAVDGMQPTAYSARVNAPIIWLQAPGTVLSLTLQRGHQRIERRVVLEDFLGQP